MSPESPAGDNSKELLRIRNRAQMELAQILFIGESPNEAMMRFTDEGYSGRFRKLLDENDELHKRVTMQDPSVLQEIADLLSLPEEKQEVA